MQPKGTHMYALTLLNVTDMNTKVLPSLPIKVATVSFLRNY